MNTRTARTPSDHVRETPESAALTLGAGSRARGGSEAVDFLPVGTKLFKGVMVGALSTRRTGFVAPHGSLVNIQWPYVLRENTAQGYDLHPGNLAEALRRGGVEIEAQGGPLAFVTAADSAGCVLPASTSSEIGRSDRCIIWDAGNNLHSADSRLGDIMANLGSGRLMVLSASASDENYARGARLTPVAVWGRDVPQGLLFSASTRRPGLVTDTDFATTVAAWFGVPVDAFPMRPFGQQAWTFLPSTTALAQVGALNSGALAQWRGMKALPYFALCLGAWILGVTLLDARHTVPMWLSSVPAAAVLAVLLSTSPITLAFWLAPALLLVPYIRPLWYIALIAGILVGDMVIGDPLMQSSLLGYSAIEGARYYGIGNEAMGALIGSSLVAAHVVRLRLAHKQRVWVWLCLVVIALLLGSPSGGAKAGGIIVAMAAFGTYAWSVSGLRWSARVVGAGIILISFVLLGIASLDAHVSATRASHLGQAMARLASGGFGEWEDIISRKLAVESHLLWHSAWAVPLWGGLVSVLARRHLWAQQDRTLLLAGIIAAASCLAVNDAGTVAAALCLALLWSGLSASTQTKARRLAEQATG